MTHRLLVIVALAFGPALFAGEEPTRVPLEIKLPRPMFTGTKKDFKLQPWMEKPLGKPRPPFLAPEGTTNVALRKPVTSSDKEPFTGNIEMVTDGDKEGIDGSFVELGPERQWVQLDLQAPYSIYAIVIWHYHGESRLYHDVVVQLADDADLITNVRTIFNNDHDSSSGLGVGKDLEYFENNEGKLIDAKGENARFVRLYSRGNSSSDQNHYTELEVYGKPVK